MNHKEFNAVFDHVNQVFKEVDKTFKTVEQVMDRAYSQIKYPWKKWFAWRPVKVKGKWKWMRTVYRREIPKTYVDQDNWTFYEYGNIFDVIKDAN